MHAVQEEEEKIRPKKDRVFGGAKMGQKSGKEPGQTREEKKNIGLPGSVGKGPWLLRCFSHRFYKHFEIR
jgi:hypothetical protein